MDKEQPKPSGRVESVALVRSQRAIRASPGEMHSVSFGGVAVCASLMSPDVGEGAHTPSLKPSVS